MSPRVRRNEWRALAVPDVGGYEPTLSVTVVVPAFHAQRLLPVVLAGLAAQTYPEHLLDVVVVDDDPRDTDQTEPALVLPDVRPARTRLLRTATGWGCACATETGVLAAEGDVVLLLDADMLVERDHVAEQMRWHHVVDHAVVLGHKWFVDPAPALASPPSSIRDAVRDVRLAEVFADVEREPHDWVEAFYERTDDLHLAGWRAQRTHVGATVSMPRALYRDAGGMDTTLRLGEDVELGYRLAEAGAFFVPERRATAWHLGPSHVMAQREAVNAYNDPFLADRIPDLRAKRRPGRTYAVPYLDVVIDTTGPDHVDHAQVVALVDAVLLSRDLDLVVTLVGPWSTLDDVRRAPLDDPRLDVRLVEATYRSDPRVRLVEAPTPGRPDAMFRLLMPHAGWSPTPDALADLVLHLELTHDGLRVVRLPDGATARLERTAAFSRARRVRGDGEDLDAVVEQVAGVGEVEAATAGFVATASLTPRTMRGTASPPLEPEQAWARVARGRRRRADPADR